MQLNCPDCRYPIPYNDVNIVKTIAKCKQCDNIFDFVEEEDGSDRPLLSPRRKELVIPPGIEVLSLASELEIIVNWRKSGSFAAPIGAIVSLASIFFVALFLLASGEAMPIIFMGPFLLSSFSTLFGSLAYMVNKTYITVTEERLAIEHKPVKAFFQKDQYFLPEDIDQLYTTRYVKAKGNNGAIYGYTVEMILKNGKKQKLVENLHSAEYARFIEQEIEFFMKIQDRPIKGEWSVRES